MNIIRIITSAVTAAVLVSCTSDINVKVQKIENRNAVPSGHIERLFFHSQYVVNRNLDVWIPEGYPKDAPYRVIYANDGGSLFGLKNKDGELQIFNKNEWEFDETVTNLMERGIIPPTIVVGVYNSGMTRFEEYFPERAADAEGLAKIDEIEDKHFTPRADNYLKYIVKEIKPYIDSHYKVDSSREATSIMGSSMGGLISMYAQCEYPEVFGGSGCLSTHWLGTIQGTMKETGSEVPDMIINYIKKHLPAVEKGGKFYFDHGDQQLDAKYPEYQAKVNKVMAEKGYGPDQWQTHVFKGETHNAHSWSRRLDIPIRFLAGKTPLKADAPKTKYRVYFMGGQSNMEGFGFNKDLDDAMNNPQYDIMCFNGTIAGDNDVERAAKGVWDFLRPGNGTAYRSDGITNTYSDRFGPELAFGIQIAKEHPGEKIAIIKYARGGSSLVAGTSGFGTWDPVFDEGLGKNQLDHYYKTLNNALNVKDIDNDGIEDELIPCGIVWMQGESDGSKFHTAMTYYDHLTRLIQLIRGSLRDNDLPVVIGKISDSIKSGSHKHIPYEYMIHAAQKKYCETDPHAIWVKNPENYHFIADGYHYTSADFVDLGIAFAKAMANLEK